MPYRNCSMLLVLCLVVAAGAMAQPAPEFPKSELNRGHVGWVVLDCTLGDDGSVVNVDVARSSGNEAFENAALGIVRSWQLGSAGGQQATVLVNFVFKDQEPSLSKKFIGRNRKIHGLIDRNQLDKAQALIDDFRTQNELNPFELAYSFVAEARIAESRGDKAGQLLSFRRAMLDNGRWVADDTYVRLLYATTILGLQQNDLASAIRDYGLLVELESGRAIASKIEGTIEAAKEYLAENGSDASPYVVANHVVDVEEERPRHLEGYDVYTGAGSGWAMSSDRADTPPANN